MSNAFRTMIVPAANVQLARDIAITLSPAGGVAMWTTGLSADGSEPATHYVSTGIINEQFAVLMPEQMWQQQEDGSWTMTDSVPGDPATIHGLCVAAGMTVTLADVQAVFTAADVTVQEPFAAMGRMGLQLVSSGDV